RAGSPRSAHRPHRGDPARDPRRRAGRPATRLPHAGAQPRGEHAVLEVPGPRDHAQRGRHECRHRADARAGAERRVTTGKTLFGLATPPLSLYVHFPWCVRKCPYCDLNSYTLHGELAEAHYVEEIERDLEAQSADVAGREVISILLGGGPPSLLHPQALGG